MLRNYDKKGAKEYFDPEIFETELNINFIEQQEEFIGYWCNWKSFSIPDPNQPNSTDKSTQISTLLLYFYTESPDNEGNVLKKCVFNYEPYFYIIVKPDIIEEFQQFISKRFEDKISSTEIISKVDLDMINHLSGIKKKVIKVNFKNISNWVHVRNFLRPIVQKNQRKEKVLTYSEWLNPSAKVDLLEMIQDLREDDIPYHVRVCIDNEIRCGCWYKVKSTEQGCAWTKLESKLTKSPLTVLAFDIETTKAPLKFPDPRIDSVMLWSYMIDGDGYLITNRSIISEEIEDFQYTPKPEFDGHFHIFNEVDEEALLKRFVKHCKERRINIFVTFNGDYFDIPFIGQRLKVYGMSLEKDLGIQNVTNSSKPGEGEYMGRFSVHIDCLYWVKRDAFLPQGSHGLKAVTKNKLGYDPIEVDPEKMLESAKETPKQFCAYSVSDALATYYLYKLMIHDFIYALCTIIPTYPDEVLRKGSGTWCEELLMAQAFRRNIIFPEKQVDKFEKFYKGHLIDTETYIGGHVECLNVGVYRADFPTTFTFDPSAYDYLLDKTESYIKFFFDIEKEGKLDISNATNYTEVINDIKSRWQSLKDLGNAASNHEVELTPWIYHLDVGAMYPNIILTNKLQPVSIVDENICAGCIYNHKDAKCQRRWEWNWRGEIFPWTRSEYEDRKIQWEYELRRTGNSSEDQIMNLDINEYNKHLVKLIKQFCSKNYKQVHKKKIELKEGIVCMRENPFYVDTIRDFRDRRYDFKKLVKTWKGKYEDAASVKDQEGMWNSKNMMDWYESLQLAHKIILNSFYGYVMRKGSRWFSMEMAAMVTHQGSNIITDAREFCERIGKPWEWDTDGIWCCWPKGFPEEYKISMKDGSKQNFSFPCTMLNSMTYDKYSNPQYNYVDEEGKWRIKNEMSVFFEVDGPYKMMILPAAKEEGKTLKKRYAVYNFSGKITELKGFELKRRGELKIIKIFQSEVFDQFLKGTNWKECYAACAEIVGRWYSILEAEGEGINDEEWLEYIEESRMMSKALEEYGAQKSTAITCAKRWGEILGTELLKDKGWCSKFIISKKPLEAPVAERAVPTVIFQSSPNIRKKCWRKWWNDYTIEDIDMREVIDWKYYKERWAGNILKIIIIPAALQKIENPYPNIPYPDWVGRWMSRKNNTQRNLRNYFSDINKDDRMLAVTEDLGRIEIKNNWNKNTIKSNKNIDKYFAEQRESINNSNINAWNKNSITKQKPEKEEEEEEKTLVDENVPTVNIIDDFDGWWCQQKSKWKKHLQKKRKKESIISLQIKSTVKNKCAFTSSDKEETFKKTTISIIQVIENQETPGKLWLWVSFGNYIECITINMKRRIYINSWKQNVPNIFTPVKLALPRNKPILNWYEFDWEESDFKEKFNNFNDYLISPSIEGVYETKIPWLFQMIKDYGCSIKFKNKRILDKSISKFEFNLEDFESKGAIDNNKWYDKIYFYYSTLGSRHFIALFFTERKKAFVTLVNTIHKNIEKPNIKKMILNCVNRKFERNEDVDINEWIAQWDYEIVTTIEQDIKVAMKNLNKILYDYRYSPWYHNDTPSIPLIVFQSVLPVDKLSLLGFTSIATDFPIMTLQFNAEENNFPAWDWIRYGVDNLATHWIDLDGIYEFRSQLSNYCNIPKCNIEEDAMLFCTDLIFSRVLKASKQILWYCPSGFPDLGGGDWNHDFLGQIDNKFPSICNPGWYLGYVVEIDIGRFCVNAILQSEHMKDFSGKYELGHVDNFNKNINDKALSNTTFVNLKKWDEYKLERDEFAWGSNAFVVIKKMTEKWLDDVVQYENWSADHLLVHFYRWIASFNSKFYDPVIYRMINLLMQKYFSILVSKVTALEYEIIYGDNKKLILFKKRSNWNIFQTDIEDGWIANIKKIPIFNHWDLTVNQYWKMWWFKDLFNYAGVYVHDEDLNDMGNDITIPRKIASKWTWSKFLPSVLEKDFISIISDYMWKLYNFFYVKDAEMVSSWISLYTNTNFDISKAKEMWECLTPNVLVDATWTADNSIENKRDVIAEFKTFWVNNYWSIKMFNIIPNIMLKRQSYKDEDYDYDIDNDIDNSNPEYGNNENKAKASGYGNVYTRADFGDDSEEYSDFDEYWNENNEDNNDYDDATNYKQIVKSKKPNNKKESKDTTNQNKPQINKPKKQSIWDYPVRLGTYDLASRTNIAIEYINDICEILSLDKSIVTDAILWKRNCLKLVNVEEYSKETIFKDPCRTFTLYDIICESCSNNIDIDFCRDDEILKKEWRCEKCDEHLDKNMMEYLIIRKIQGIIDYYYNQDWECKRCTNQKNEFLFNLCSCAGEYKKTFDENFLGNYSNIDSITDFWRLIKDISVYYEFNMLKMIIDEFV